MQANRGADGAAGVLARGRAGSSSPGKVYRFLTVSLPQFDVRDGKAAIRVSLASPHNHRGIDPAERGGRAVFNSLTMTIPDDDGKNSPYRIGAGQGGAEFCLRLLAVTCGYLRFRSAVHGPQSTVGAQSQVESPKFKGV